jgi:predicted glycoside hydrolase/deacetylase ChbG (UPF0249 family)
MPERARVTSIEVLEAFRASLVLYLEQASNVLGQVSDEVTRTRLWLQSDRRLHWANEVRRRERELERRQSELFGARLSALKQATPEHRAAVEKAKRALAEAQTKLEHVNQWIRQDESLVVPRAKEVEKLRDVLELNMSHAETFLRQALEALAAYAETRPLTAAPAPATDAGKADADSKPAPSTS